MPKENNIKEMLVEIKEGAEALKGWDELQILCIHKYGIEAVIKTSKGDIKMSMKELFTQYYFTLKVFETLGIYLVKVKDKVYEKWLSEWAKSIIDMGSVYGNGLDFLKESLELYTESADDREEEYLRRGEPIRIEKNVVAFRSVEFILWLKKRYNVSYTNDQIHTGLRDIGCLSKRVGKDRIRAWTYKKEDQIEPTLLNISDVL
jgi:hypothetical protein